MKARALRICLAGDLLAFALTAGSYEVLEYYERLESQTNGVYFGPGFLFMLCFAGTVAALLTTLGVALFWPRDPGPEGTGLSPK